MISDVHIFKVWHPEDGLPSEYKEKEFHFTFPISRTDARRIISEREGYAILTEGKKRGPTYSTQRRSKKK